jgi:hypothetical protein
MKDERISNEYGSIIKWCLHEMLQAMTLELKKGAIISENLLEGERACFYVEIIALAVFV